jgi:hypothetical protein
MLHSAKLLNMSQNKLETGSFICIGSIRAVICYVYSSTNVEIVYRDTNGKYIAEDATLNGETWKFTNSGPSGTYAERSTRLQPFIQLLGHP